MECKDLQAWLKELSASDDWSTLSFLTPFHGSRLYACACTGWLEVGMHPCEDPDPDPLSGDPTLPWRCAGHPAPSLPATVDGVEIGTDRRLPARRGPRRWTFCDGCCSIARSRRRRCRMDSSILSLGTNNRTIASPAAATLLLAVAACGSPNWTLPVGWQGRLPQCDVSEVSGSGQKVDHAVRLMREGRAKVRCEDGKRYTLEARPIGSVKIVKSSSEWYEAVALDQKGRELVGPDDGQWEWSAVGVRIRGGGCTDTGSCFASWQARLFPDGPGAGKIMVKYLGASATLDVQVVRPRSD